MTTTGYKGIFFSVTLYRVCVVVYKAQEVLVSLIPLF